MRAVIIVAALCMAGCGLGRRLDSATLRLEPGEAMIVVAVDSPNLTTLSLCRDGDLASCVTAGPIAPTAPVVVYAVPAGRYCLSEVAYQPHGRGTVRHEWPASQARCFAAAAGELVYPGHLVVPGYAMASRPSIREQLDAAYPSLREHAITTPN